jgi:predicted CDP-diglyceride synthetase/phosphatidate cytidylyltransferase
MSENFLIFDPFYLQNFGFIALFLILLGTPLYFLKSKSVNHQASWSSVISWSYVLPIVFVLFALPNPYPMAVICLFSIYGLKTFFQMTGMYHRDWFVNISYILIALATYFIYVEDRSFFMATPMMALAAYILIPVFRNNYLFMVQYIGLSLIGFFVYGWAYLHGAEILNFPKGVYTLIYLYSLSELFIALNSSLSQSFGRFHLRSRITSKMKWEGFLIASVVIIFIAWSWRRMLPSDIKSDWLAIGLICILFSTLGDLFLSIIRKDLKIKDQGVFIIGRGDLLSRVNKVIFVFPAYYYFVKILELKTSF